jgi:FKBP-type peptidyl-prolyl cis-trans isomerase 2
MLKGGYMAKATDGDKVKIHYTKKLKSGEILDTSQNGPPLELRIGSNLVPFLENAAKGMGPGEEKTVEVPPEKAHGKRQKDLIMYVMKDKLPQNIQLSVGNKIDIKKTNGNRMSAMIINIKGEKVTLDANHPLAGKPLLFDIKVLEVM